MQVGEIDDEAVADAVEEVADRAAEDQRQRQHVATRLFARHPKGDGYGDEGGDRDKSPALRIVAAREHRQRNAAIFCPLQVEDRRQRNAPVGLRRERQRHDDHPFGELIEQERSEEHTSELQSLMRISYAVFCLKKKTQNTDTSNNIP